MDKDKLHRDIDPSSYSPTTSVKHLSPVPSIHSPKNSTRKSRFSSFSKRNTNNSNYSENQHFQEEEKSRSISYSERAFKDKKVNKVFEDTEMYKEVQVSNPMFNKRSSVISGGSFDEFDVKGPPPVNKMAGNFKPKPPAKPRQEIEEVSELGNFNVKTGTFNPVPPKKPRDLTKLEMDSDKMMVDNSFDSEDQDAFDAEQERINSLPLNERIWEKKIIQRIIVAALAIALLWSTSLALIRYVVEGVFFPKPSLNTVGANFVDLFETADFYRSGYSECAAIAFSNCQSNYISANSFQLSNVQNLTLDNKNRLIQYEAARSEAKILVNETLNQLIELVGRSVILAGYYNLSHQDSCPRVEQWIANQVASSNALGTYNEFTKNATTQIQSLAAQLQARDAYDNEYVANKTVEAEQFANFLADFYKTQSSRIFSDLNQSFSDYQDCAAKTPGNCNGNLGVLGEVGQDVEQAQARAAELAQQYAQTAAQVDAFVSAYNNLYQLSQQINNELPTNVQPFPNTGSADEPAIDFENLFGQAVSAAGLQDDADLYTGEAQKAIDATTAAANNAGDSFADASGDFYTNHAFDEPYDPPPINESPIAAWNEAKAQGSQDLNETLSDFDAGGSSADDFIPPSERQTTIPDSPEEILATLENRTFDFYLYPESVFGTFEEQLTFATDVATWADVCYRVLHSFYLIHKYWNLSAIGKPPADVRLDEISGKGWGLKASPQQRMAALLTHPAVVSVVSIIFSALLATAFWRFYGPFYDAYRDGCVDHNEVDIANNESQGTMIYRNLEVVTYNYCVEQGDDIQSSQVDKLNVQRELDCETNFQTSLQKYENDLNTYTAIKNDYDNSKSFRDEILDCFQISLLDANENTQPGDLKIGPALNDPQGPFFVVFKDMNEAVYNCSAIPLCAFLCEDPPERIIEHQTHVTSCTAEWWIHASILSTILVIVTFILTNVFRIEFMKAVVRIWWRHLNPFDFTFLGSCTRAGEHIDPEQVTEEHDSLRKAIRDSLKKVLKKWERMGYFHALYALGLNAPWIWACVVLSSGVSYS